MDFSSNSNLYNLSITDINRPRGHEHQPEYRLALYSGKKCSLKFNLQDDFLNFSPILLSLKVVNPDGYQYTWTTNRNWRKTRSNVSLLCFGVDGNRNFAYNWLKADETGNEGGSRVPCTDTYGENVFEITN